MPNVELTLVGRFRVLLDGHELAPREVGTRKARWLLQRLAAARGQAVMAADLAESLWGDDPPRGPAENLATLVSRLRSTLGGDVVEGDRTGWRLGALVEVDLATAAALLARAEAADGRGEPAVVAVAALAATRLLTGDVLVGEPAASWADDVRQEAALMLRRARRIAAAASRDSGDPATAVTLATDAVAADPYDEEAVRLLMRAAADLGEPGRALVAYEQLRLTLAEELGADPSVLTRALHLELLNEAAPPLAAAESARPPARPDAAARDRSQLVGRETELEQLRVRWTAAVAGRPGLLLVTGEPGIGKTRLTEELAVLVRQTGGTVLAARCYETERSLFLQPLVDAFRPELVRSSVAALRELAGDRAAPLALLVPEVASILGPLVIERRSPESERRLAYEAVATVLRRLSARGPVLVLLDDLHQAGLATIEQLHLLARTGGSEPLLVVATVRSAEGAEAVRRLEAVAEVLSLGPLSDEAVGRLATGAGHSEQGAQIARRTRGHTLSVVEMLRALSAGDDGVPASLAAAVLARVGRLEPSTQDLVRAACVLGASFEPATAAGLLSVPTAEALRGAERLVEAGLIVEAGRAYEFTNDLVQEVLYASTPEPTRYSYHRLAAELLADRPEAAAGHAAASGQHGLAATAWMQAAGAAGDRFAAADAERILSLALAAATEAGDPALVARALLERALQRETLGTYVDAVQDLNDAHEVATEAGLDAIDMLVQRALGGDAAVAIGRPMGSCAPHMFAGLEIARRLGDDAVAADLLGRLAVLSCNRLDFVGGREHGLAAVSTARRSGDPAALRRGLDGLKTSYAYVGQLPGLIEAVEELEPLVRRAGDLNLLQWLVFERSFVPMATGDWDAATALVEEALALNRRSGRLKYEGWFLAHRGWIARLACHRDDALGHGRRAVTTAPEGGHPWFEATACAMLAGTLAGTGEAADRSEAIKLLRRSLSSADRSGAEMYRLRALAPLAELTGSATDLDRADRMLSAARFPDGTAWMHGVDVYLALARGWLQAGEPQRAATLLTHLLVAADLHGWSVLAQAAGVQELLDRCLPEPGPAHSRAAKLAAARAAPSLDTGR